MASQLIELEQARGIVLGRARPLEIERLALREALGRHLAEAVAAAEPVPAADNSAMDGFAVRAAETDGAAEAAPLALRLVGESRAGRPAAIVLGPGEAVAISTGAVLPSGADAVIRLEETEARDGRVFVTRPVGSGRDIRRAGEDIEAGETVLTAGIGIGAAELGVLASLGIAEVACRRRPRVAVITSGDELLEPAEEMRPGGVRNSNAYAVPALAELAGAEASVLGAAPDDLEATIRMIEPALASDVVVLCGGVSVGPHDHVKAALAELGVEQGFWGVALKPGKPTWFGSRGDALVFGLPGNPVSAIVTFLLLVRPALDLLAGGSPERRRATARLASDYAKKPGRTHAVRCRLEVREDGWYARPTGEQGSHILTSMLGADCLALIPSASGSLPAGERVEIELLERG
jgi:molybdopterin molybdotransferase